ncbi:hypothetical protein KSF_104120 [Reticulibacter mediterranei]|uniref:GS catalytic domain-containing protein n=1 Tax=Reticulibacter mediterranei TaxID=2778369 RepID=A0A8J3IQZ6_9CHLR|nr:glutamine synthetase [Reticulibacter mediterranei]GHP00365.1 hypothetical protein KSF_104120 [Reticulibacter mediterranei]
MPRFPTSLDESLEDLERDSVLMEALGPTLSTAYLVVKRSEIEYFKDKTPQEIVKQHFYKF